MVNMSLVAAKLGVSRRELLDAIARSPVLRTLRADVREEMLDNVEASLSVAVAGKKPWAVEYVLKKLGPKYGYGEWSDLVENDAPLEQEREPPLDMSRLSDEQLAEINHLIATTHGSADGTMPADPPIIQQLDNAGATEEPHGAAVRAAIAQTKGHVAGAARLLGVARSELISGSPSVAGKKPTEKRACCRFGAAPLD